MPRTRVTKKTKPEGEYSDKKKRLLADLLIHKSTFENGLKNIQAIWQRSYDDLHTDLLTRINPKLLNLKISELEKMSTLSQDSTLGNITERDNFTQLKSTANGKTQLFRRSSSLDEGYLTTESIHSVGSTTSQKSRGRSKILTTEKRKTRSLSRNTNVSSSSLFHTPASKGPSANEFGASNPKCKPNSAQILMRRPKKGEIALSFKGSPLMVSGHGADYTANINIPLDDGTMLSLLPQQGLRISQIPALDSEMVKQLETLQQHINKVLMKENPSD